MSLPTTPESTADLVKPKLTLPAHLAATLVKPIGPIIKAQESIGTAQAHELPAAQSLEGVASNVQSDPTPGLDRGLIITVVRTIKKKKPLGKKFDLLPDGSMRKESVVKMGLCVAVMHYVPTKEAFAALLTAVSEDPYAAIINASFEGVEIGEEFYIGSARAIERYTGIPRGDRARQKGVHVIKLGDKVYKLTGRFKENVRAVKWQLLDRDVDSHTPDQFAKMSVQAWLQAFCSLVPGVATLDYCHAQSTSARVLRDGVPVGGGNGHVWIMVKDPTDIERCRPAILLSAIGHGMSWRKPRYSRTEPGKVIGHSLTTLIDTSVWTPGRIVFVGKPVVGPGLTVAAQEIVVHGSTGTPELDTSLLGLPEAAVIQDVTRKAGVEMTVHRSASGLKVSANDLTLDTELETENPGTVTVRELLERGQPAKVRCQTPFRASNSFAAFYSTNADGKPYVHDVGTSTTHWLGSKEAREVDLVAATGTVQAMLTKTKTDCGAPFESSSIAALTLIQSRDPAQYRRIRAELKRINKDVSVPAIDQAIKAHAVQAKEAQTHHGYATDQLGRLTVDGFAPVSYEGTLYVVDPNTGLWVKVSMDALARLVAETHDGKDNCSRKSDYSGIAQHAITLVADEAFFKNAPIGLACPGGFYQVKDGGIEVLALTPDHRQRVMLGVTPTAMATPLFNGFLHETFESPTPGDEVAQIGLLQEASGAIMLGIAYRYQKAFLFYEPFGRAGKGVMVAIESALVPPEFVTAVSPFVWDREYYIASLAGARLNVVGELPEGQPIPAAAVKTVLGCDLLTGRHPTHRPISFSNEAGHVFSSNHLIYTKDHSEAFYARWKVLEFPNSRLRLGLPQDPSLAQRIIANELPGIAQWALEGAMRVIRNGGYSQSAVHDRLMAQWRRSTNSLEEFVHECCLAGDPTLSILRSELYRNYALWCKETGRHAFAKGRVKELLEHNIGLGVSLTKVDGYERFRGLQMRPDFDVFEVE